jgi:RNA recognition motif-containing protein
MTLAEYQSLLEDRKARATAFLLSQGFEVVTQNGQRISTNTAVSEQFINSLEYSEVFIGRLPRDLFEDELYPHLMRVGGTIIKIRFMMDFSGSNRGFAFVKFASPKEAVRATILLDDKPLRPSSPPIGVKLSFDNKCLYFGNLPPTCTAEQLVRSLEKAEITGIVSARMADTPKTTMAGPLNQALNPRGLPMLSHNNPTSRHSRFQQQSLSRYGYVYFESHDAATKARRILMPSQATILGRKITLDWAKSEIPPEIVELVSAL